MAGIRDVLVTIRRVEPPPSPKSAELSLMIGSGPDRHLFGFLPGRYHVEVKQRRGTAPAVTRETYLDVVRGIVELDVGAMLEP